MLASAAPTPVHVTWSLLCCTTNRRVGVVPVTVPATRTSSTHRAMLSVANGALVSGPPMLAPTAPKVTGGADSTPFEDVGDTCTVSFGRTFITLLWLNNPSPSRPL